MITRRQKDPLRSLTADERQWLERISRSRSDPASQVLRAKLLLAVADGASYTAAAHSVGRRLLQEGYVEDWRYHFHATCVKTILAPL